MTDAELAIAAVDAGVVVIRGWAGRQAALYEKAGDDFATEADIEAETAMVEILRAHRRTRSVTI